MSASNLTGKGPDKWKNFLLFLFALAIGVYGFELVHSLLCTHH